MRDRASDQNDDWNQQWVPFASDLGLNVLVLDHGTNPGRVLLVDGVDGLHGHRTWPSLTDLTDQVSEALLASTVLNGHQPVVEDKRLRWSDAN
ncbi:SMI1/KNR4 family protein [Dactylosporangium sp. NBC_01737]|uniref:hypothetical protein n=1 Tax=Dactylosporangium sp. NBC_01737 TaxID=2975959 RepID=UPI002E131149|nr:SMI1/KNR4 family protein [Dactylosporangium sp. NBC_01737]